MNIIVRQLEESDLVDATRIVAEAFSIHLGIDPEDFISLEDLSARWQVEPQACFGAFDNDDMAGVVIGTTRGKFGYFGPLSVSPAHWNKGIAQKLMLQIEKYFDDQKVLARGLYTYSNSVKHIRLYERFGYNTNYLTAILSRTIAPKPLPEGISYQLFSTLDAASRRDSLKQLDELTDEICQGLTVSREVDRGAQYSKNIQSETILVYERGQLIGFALCPMASLKAKTRPLYAKFAAAKNSSKTSRDAGSNFDQRNFDEGNFGERNFEALITSLDQHGQNIGAAQILGAVSTARRSCYKRMLSLGFTPNAYGIAMIKPDLSAYNVDGIYVLDDWR